MPIHDAVDLARFLVQTTIGVVKFSVSRPKTVGGPIEIAAINEARGASSGPSGDTSSRRSTASD